MKFLGVRTLRRRSPARAVFVAVLAFAIAAPAMVFASHFRYGNNSWRPGAGANEIQFQVNEAWRRSAFGGSGADGLAMPGDVVATNTLTYGDGGSDTVELLVTSIDTDDDWLFGTALDPDRPAGDTTDTTINHTYAAPGDYTMATETCCRVGQTATNHHVNNPDQPNRVETLVNVGSGNSSPVTTLPPIVKCPTSGTCSFQVPANDPDGDTLSYRFSTSQEAAGTIFGGSFVQPGAPHAPNDATIDANTGMYSWDTTGATLSPNPSANTLYSTQVMIEDLDATGAVKSRVALDFIIELTEEVGEPPVFGGSPVCGTTQNVAPGNTLSYTITGSDPDAGDTVTLNAAGIPAGATHNPALPAEGNPVSSDFSWTPTAAQTGTFVVTYTVTDDTGQQGLCSVTIVVEEDDDPEPPDDPCDDPDAILGTAGDDFIRGTRGDDIICGLGGNDRIRARAGNDLIFGGGGNDKLRGGRGDDEIHGGAGHDNVFGNRGDDTLFGNEGMDRLVGGLDHDLCDAGGDPGDREAKCEGSP